MKALQKYLSEHAETENTLLTKDSNWPTQLVWQHCLCIPAYQEPAGFIDALFPAYRAVSSSLLILIINRPDSSTSDTGWASDITSKLEPALWRAQHLSLHPWPAAAPASNTQPHHILLVDRCMNGKPLPRKQGVGLARKIAADLASLLIQQQQILSPWIHCSDADAVLPVDYFTASQHAETGDSAVLYPFRHQPSSDLTPSWPADYYDWHLRYYVAGLLHAESPWAFSTIGSCLCLHHLSYAQVRGFPKRSAGEDFYLLNKLGKVGTVRSSSEALLSPLCLAARPSTRVPFGTGPALQKMQVLEAEQALSYHPSLFIRLRIILAALRQCCEGLPLSKEQRQCLENAGLNELSQNIAQQAPQRRQHYLRQQLDAFETRQLLHRLRSEDPQLSDISMHEAASLATQMGIAVPPLQRFKPN